jgi:hypothetical protein
VASDQRWDPLLSEAAVQRSSVRRLMAAIVFLYALSDGAHAWSEALISSAKGHTLPWMVCFKIVACVAGITAALGLKTRRTWTSQSYAAWAVLVALDSVLSLARFGASLVAGHRFSTRARVASDDPFTHMPVIMATLAADLAATLALLGVLWLGFRYLTASPAKEADSS